MHLHVMQHISYTRTDFGEMAPFIPGFFKYTARQYLNQVRYGQIFAKKKKRLFYSISKISKQGPQMMCLLTHTLVG